MEIVEMKGGEGNIIRYKIINETAYHEATPDNIVQIIEAARQDRTTRLRFAWGDVKTGRDWGDTYDIAGTIGRSTGRIKVPLLIRTSRSTGGSALLDDCIVRIEKKAQGCKGYVVIYQHPKYNKAAA